MVGGICCAAVSAMSACRLANGVAPGTKDGGLLSICWIGHAPHMRDFAGSRQCPHQTAGCRYRLVDGRLLLENMRFLRLLYGLRSLLLSNRLFGWLRL